MLVRVTKVDDEIELEDEDFKKSSINLNLKIGEYEVDLYTKGSSNVLKLSDSSDILYEGEIYDDWFIYLEVFIHRGLLEKPKPKPTLNSYYSYRMHICNQHKDPEKRVEYDIPEERQAKFDFECEGVVNKYSFRLTRWDYSIRHVCGKELSQETKDELK
jgi:hypothetical protein